MSRHPVSIRGRLVVCSSKESADRARLAWLQSATRPAPKAKPKRARAPKETDR